MASSYIVAGSMVVDRIIPYGAEEKSCRRLGGGAAYALFGTKLWTDDCMVTAYSGKDFRSYYGRWMEENGFSDEGIIKKFPRTNSGDVRYDAYGLYTCTDNEPEYFNFGDMPDEALLTPLLSKNTKGVHLLTLGDTDNLSRLGALRRQYGFMLGIEMEPVCRGKPAAEAVSEITREDVDFFSLNYSEVRQLFPQVRDEQDAIELMCSFSCPVFFRMGQRGACMIIEHRPFFSPMVDDFGTVDATGCGNSSTAAAFWAFCEGWEAQEISYVGAITASLNASKMGLPEKYEPWMREKCRQMVKAYTTRESGFAMCENRRSNEQKKF